MGHMRQVLSDWRRTVAVPLRYFISKLSPEQCREGRSRGLRIWEMGICAALASLLVSSTNADDLQTCSDRQFSVEAPNDELLETLCHAAPSIRDTLSDCGLTQTRPLTIKVVEELSHKIGNCLAWFDCDHDSIRLTNPTRYPEVIEQDSPYATLPPDVLLENALTHELVHALITQSANGREVSLIDHEYIAAALELELMEPQWRDVLISAAPVSLPPKTGLIDIWIYGLEPRKFATNAWQHFSLPQNGCGLVERIVQGDETLSRSSR